MPEYRRGFEPGGRFFFTVVTDRRRLIFLDSLARTCLREAILSVQAERPYSTFERYVKEKIYEPDWLCGCDGRIPKRMDFSMIEGMVGK